MLSVDLNCDMGEGMDNDEAIMPFISSVNIACGYHAGDAAIMERTVALSLLHGVAIGAHPSYPDRANFGRVDLLDEGACVASGVAPLDPAGLPDLLTHQLVMLKDICVRQDATLHHVKLHGALYNRAAKDPALSAILCEAIRQFDGSLYVYGLSGSVMHTEAKRCGLRFVHEVFSDRTYQEDGSLTPRTMPGALIEDPALAVRQVLIMVQEGRADTVCIHGDGSHAAEFARMIHEGLTQNGILLKAPGRLDPF